MPEPASSAIHSFIQRWQASSGNERGNYQLFLSEWCDLLGVARPDPKGAIARPSLADSPNCCSAILLALVMRMITGLSALSA